MTISINSYDARTGRLGDVSGNSPRNHTRPIYQYETEDIDSVDEDEEEIDDFVDDVIAHKIRMKSGAFSKTRDDIGRRPTAGDYAGIGRGLLEYFESTTPARQGISPFSNKTLYPGGFSGGSISTGAADQIYRTTGNFKRTGTQYGTSRAPLPKKDEFDENIFSLSDLKNSVDKNVEKHNYNINKIKKLLDSLENS